MLTQQQDDNTPAALPVVRVESMAITYRGGVRALGPVSLDIRQGEFTVLLGASGAGKSTLLRSLNGLVIPSAGRITAEGLGDLADSSVLHRHRRLTGMIFQQHHLIGRLTVLANVLTGRLGYRHPVSTLLPWPRHDRELALLAIDRVGLLEHALARADQLSGGQQQRVGVARALVQHPRLLLADEPIASLDPASAERLLALIHGVCRRDGLTAVVSLHQVEFARRFADRIIGLAAGKVVFDGPPSLLDRAQIDRLYGENNLSSPALPTAPPASSTVCEGVPA